MAKKKRLSAEDREERIRLEEYAYGKLRAFEECRKDLLEWAVTNFRGKIDKDAMLLRSAAEFIEAKVTAQRALIERRQSGDLS